MFPYSTINRYQTTMDDFYLFANCNFVPDKYNDVCMLLFQLNSTANAPTVASRLRLPRNLRPRLRTHHKNILLRHPNRLRTQLLLHNQHVRLRSLRHARRPIRHTPHFPSHADFSRKDTIGKYHGSGSESLPVRSWVFGCEWQERRGGRDAGC